MDISIEMFTRAVGVALHMAVDLLDQDEEYDQELFCRGWSGKDELRLLRSVERNGYGNWSICFILT